jgi:hypothetical protein
MPKVGQVALTRNTLLNEPVAALADRNSSRTDILHEYFVPPDRLNDFPAACREIVPAHKQDCSMSRCATSMRIHRAC